MSIIVVITFVTMQIKAITVETKMKRIILTLLLLLISSNAFATWDTSGNPYILTATDTQWPNGNTQTYTPNPVETAIQIGTAADRSIALNLADYDGDNLLFSGGNWNPKIATVFGIYNAGSGTGSAIRRNEPNLTVILDGGTINASGKEGGVNYSLNNGGYSLVGTFQNGNATNPSTLLGGSNYAIRSVSNTILTFNDHSYVDGNIIATTINGNQATFNFNGNTEIVNGGITATRGAVTFDFNGTTSIGGDVTVNASGNQTSTTLTFDGGSDTTVTGDFSVGTQGTSAHQLNLYADDTGGGTSLTIDEIEIENTAGLQATSAISIYGGNGNITAVQNADPAQKTDIVFDGEILNLEAGDVAGTTNVSFNLAPTTNNLETINFTAGDLPTGETNTLDFSGISTNSLSYVEPAATSTDLNFVGGSNAGGPVGTSKFIGNFKQVTGAANTLFFSTAATDATDTTFDLSQLGVGSVGNEAAINLGTGTNTLDFSGHTGNVTTTVTLTDNTDPAAPVGKLVVTGSDLDITGPAAGNVLLNGTVEFQGVAADLDVTPGAGTFVITDLKLDGGHTHALALGGATVGISLDEGTSTLDFEGGAGTVNELRLIDGNGDGTNTTNATISNQGTVTLGDVRVFGTTTDVTLQLGTATVADLHYEEAGAHTLTCNVTGTIYFPSGASSADLSGVTGAITGGVVLGAGADVQMVGGSFGNVGLFSTQGDIHAIEFAAGTGTLAMGSATVTMASPTDDDTVTFSAGAGGSLDLGSTNVQFTGAGDNELIFDLAATTTLNLNSFTLTADASKDRVIAQGIYQYNADFYDHAAFVNQALIIGDGVNRSTLRVQGGDYLGTATSPASLTIASNSKLWITLDGNDANTFTQSKVTVVDQMMIDKSQLDVDLVNFGDPQAGRTFTLLNAPVGGISDLSGTPWTEGSFTTGIDVTQIAGFEVEWTYSYGLLTGVLSSLAPPPSPVGVTNLDAMWEISNANPPAGSDTDKAKQSINNATTIEEKDHIVQQFTPSMALASAANNVQTNTRVLEAVAGNIVVPWRSHYQDGGKNLIRAQNLRLPAEYSAISNSSSWFQGFGYLGQQAVKDDFAAYDNTGWGFAIGLDWSLGRSCLAGLAYGHSQTGLQSQSFNAGAEIPTNVNTLGHTLLGYLAIRTTHTSFLTLKAGNTWYKIDGMRRPFEDAPNHIYAYNTDATTWFIQATFGYEWVQRPSFTLTPKAKFVYYGYSQDAYEEKRPSLDVTQVGAFSNGYTQADILLDWQFFFSDQLTLTSSTGYRLLGGAEGAVLTAATDGVSYEVNGVSPAVHQLVLDAGGVFTVNNCLSILSEYNFRTGEGSHLHGGTATLVVSF